MVELASVVFAISANKKYSNNKNKTTQANVKS